MTEHSPEELRRKFWKHLRSDRTAMVGLPGKAAGRPMTALVPEGEDRGPIWFFTADDTDLGRLTAPAPVEMAFVSKGHEIFATVHGKAQVHMDRDMIDRLWSPYVEAWFEQGKDDPKLRLVRFDAEEAEIWLNASSLFAGIRMWLGAGDPKEDYRENVAKVRLA